MIRVRWIDSNAADEATRTVRGKRIQPGVCDAGVCGVGIFRDKHASCRRRRPQSCGVRAGARERRHVAAGPRRSAVICSTCCQICCASRADLDKVAAGRIETGCRKLRAVGFEEYPIASPILSPPDAQRPFENRPSASRISDDGRVKLCAFTAGPDWTAGNNPLQGIATPEVYIVSVGGEAVEPQRRIAQVKPRLTAIAVDFLRPDRCRTGCFFKCAVILRAAHQVACVGGVNRHTLKLQC